MPDLPSAAPILCHGLPILLRGSAMFLHDVPTGLRTGVLYEMNRPAAGPYVMNLTTAAGPCVMSLTTAAGPHEMSLLMTAGLYEMSLTTAAGLYEMNLTTAADLYVMRLMMTAGPYVMKLMTADLFGSAARAVHSGCRGPARSAPVYQPSPVRLSEE